VEDIFTLTPVFQNLLQIVSFEAPIVGLMKAINIATIFMDFLIVEHKVTPEYHWRKNSVYHNHRPIQPRNDFDSGET
jgi:hypothetical protein